MSEVILSVKNLTASIDGNQILKGVSSAVANLVQQPDYANSTLFPNTHSNLGNI